MQIGSHTTYSCWFCLLGALLAVSALASPPPPLEDPFLVHTETTGNQGAPDVDVADGAFLVVWVQPGSSVAFQRFAEDGQPMGGMGLADPGITDAKSQPRVALDPSGEFLLLWETFVDVGQALSSRLLDVRPFDALGEPSAATTTAFGMGAAFNSFQGHEIVGGTPGEWVISHSVIDGYAIAGFLLTQHQSSAGSISQNTLSTNLDDFYQSSLDLGPGGHHLMAWQVIEGVSGLTAGAVQAQRLDSAGLPVGPVIDIASEVDFFDGSNVDVALDPEGGFLATWGAADRATGIRGVSDDIWARAFGSDGAPLGPGLRINTVTTGLQRAPRVARGSDGTFLVVWQSASSGAEGVDESEVIARRLDARGQPMGGEIVVDPGNGVDQRGPRVAGDESGDTFVVAWTAKSLLGDHDVWARRFLADLILGEGFESGTFDSWAVTAP